MSKITFQDIFGPDSPQKSTKIAKTTPESPSIRKILKRPSGKPLKFTQFPLIPAKECIGERIQSTQMATLKDTSQIRHKVDNLQADFNALNKREHLKNLKIDRILSENQVLKLNNKVMTRKLGEIQESQAKLLKLLESFQVKQTPNILSEKP